MKRWLIVPISVVVLISGAAGGQAAVSSRRTADLSAHRDRLLATWQQDARLGVPDAQLQPLRQQLAGVRVPVWWSPDWWGDGAQQSLDRLDSSTDTVFAGAVGAARATSESVVADARAFLADVRAEAPADFAGAVAAWDQQVQAAATPVDLERLTAQHRSALTQARTQVATARAQTEARVTAEADARATVDSVGGPEVLLAAVPAVDQTARNDNLDPSDVDTLAAQLRSEIAAGQPGTATAARLADAVATFKQTVAANDRISVALAPLAWQIDGASMLATPSAPSFQTQIGTLRNTFTAARTAAEIAAVEQQETGLKAAVDREAQAANCGHDTGAGKAIVVSLSLQHFIAYQDGCAVKDGPVTTGRPQLPTPTGSFHVFYKTSPFTMVSPWPKESPFWYPTTPVSWVLEFQYGGYFLHDADWESNAAYGPGSENNPYAASHGCIHIQTSTMEWLYSWTPTGTPVTVIS